ncbi:hypothetical protein [Maricaulis sp. CAU 1757]
MIQSLSANAIILLGFGLYALAVGLGMLVDPDRMERLLAELRQLAVAGFIAGILTLGIGVAMLGLAGPGPGLDAIVVRVLGWAALIKGLVLLVHPGWLLGFSNRFMASERMVRAWSVVTLVMGALALVLALL